MADRLIKAAEEKKAAQAAEAQSKAQETKERKAKAILKEADTAPPKSSSASIQAETRPANGQRPGRPARDSRANPMYVVIPEGATQIEVRIVVTIRNEPGRESYAWGYIKRGGGVLTCGAVLNAACDPTLSAVLTKNWPMIRWLVMLAIIERIIVEGRRLPEVSRAARYLWKLVGNQPGTYWDGLGVSCRLARHEITAAIESFDLTRIGELHQFGSFNINT